jgi:esterase/lipase superfamily enzyme
LFFSWPSDGALLNYTYDEADLYWSVEPLRQTMLDMNRHFGKGNSNIVAHSLGTRGVFLALVMMARSEQVNKPLFDQVVFMAPDIDAAIFKQYLPLIRPLVNNITVYVSGNDKSLALSRQVHGYPRLGEPGEHLDGLTGINIIDVSDMPVRYLSGHVYHLYHKTVVKDLAQLLNEGLPASQRSNLEQAGKNYWRLQPTVVE